MTLKYIQANPDLELINISYLNPFRSIVIVDEKVSSKWQSLISKWLVESGCLYMLAWGINCSSWDDSVDYANMQEFDYGEIPKDKFVITTWHENETLKELFWFSKNNAFHPIIDLKNTLIIHISKDDKEKEMLSTYESA